jgi:hypothetical protein
MIRVVFITERYALPRHPEDDIPDEPYCTATQECSLTFRELVEALQEYNDCSNWPPQGSPGEWATEKEDVFTSSGDIVIKSLHLADETRARYWRKAMLGRFCRVQG